MEMCQMLADKVNAAYQGEKLYVIGFAETATGIASAVSHYLTNVVYYQNTTREYREDEDYLFFTESHSHATDQTLRAAGVGECLQGIDRVIFIDDEVTTGSTICKLIDVLKEKYDLPGLKCSIVSILNSVPQERMEQLKKIGIDFLYLSEIPYEYNIGSIKDIEYDVSRDTVIEADGIQGVDEIDFLSDLNARNVLDFKKYDNENESFAEFVENSLNTDKYRDVLILGTEEFMYPAFCLGKLLIDDNRAEEVRIHATTRSPIIASGEEDYPLFSRYCIKSLYDDSRPTYVYNLREYEKVIIVTDALKRENGESDLICALKSVGNKDITISRWHSR